MNQVTRTHSAALLAAAILIACDNTHEPVDMCGSRPVARGEISLAIETDKSSYSLTTDTGMETSITNTGTEPIYIDGHFASIERFENGAWITMGPWVVADGVCARFDIAPGSRLTVPKVTFGYVSNKPGTYRFNYKLSRDPVGREIISEALRVSSTFEVKL